MYKHYFSDTHFALARIKNGEVQDAQFFLKIEGDTKFSEVTHAIRSNECAHDSFLQEIQDAYDKDASTHHGDDADDWYIDERKAGV
jgi:hypothetical protein